MQKGRIRQSTNSQQTHCKTFNNCTRGSDPNWVWNTAECKCTLEAFLKGVSTKHATEQHMHLNRNKAQEIHHNSLKHFPLQSFSKNLTWFRCRGKRGASEPRNKAESGSQLTHNKHIARLSATVPVVQIPGGFGTPQNANVPWRHFWQGYPPNAQQNSTGI